VGNKADKEDLVVTEEDMSMLAEKCQVQCFFTSALTGLNVE